MDKLDYILIILIIAIVISAFTLGYNLASQRVTISSTIEIKDKVTPISECQNNSLKGAVECLRNNFSSWWHYNISNVANFNMNQSDLIKEGGVCRQASEYYVAQAKSLGFLGITISFFNNSANDSSSLGHEIALLYDKNMDQYCVIDQNSLLSCQDLAP